MADAFQGSGKIYVVIATIVIVFLGLVIYLIGMGRQIRTLEKEQLNRNGHTP